MNRMFIGMVLTVVMGALGCSKVARTTPSLMITAQAQSAPSPQPGVPQGRHAYYCGALTKKGTACKRRVKKQGDHCYLHGGAK